MSAERTTVAFSGNRIMKSPPDSSVEDLEGVVLLELSRLLEMLYADGKRCFMSGGAIGFDIIAAEAVLALRSKHADVELVLVVPFEGQEAKYPEADKVRYRSIVAEADRVEVICETYSTGAYHQRNDFMVQHCSTLVAYSDGRGRGTTSTIRRAVKCQKEIINLYEILFGTLYNAQLSLDL